MHCSGRGVILFICLPVTDILKLKAAKVSGWMNEDEFEFELKRAIQEWNGHAREPAYSFSDDEEDDEAADEMEQQQSSTRRPEDTAEQTSERREATPPPLSQAHQMPPLSHAEAASAAAAAATPHRESSEEDSIATACGTLSPTPKAKLAPMSDDILLLAPETPDQS